MVLAFYENCFQLPETYDIEKWSRKCKYIFPKQDLARVNPYIQVNFAETLLL